MENSVLDAVKIQQLRGQLYWVGWRQCEIEHLLRFLEEHPPTLEDIAGLDMKRLEDVALFGANWQDHRWGNQP